LYAREINFEDRAQRESDDSGYAGVNKTKNDLAREL